MIPGTNLFNQAMTVFTPQAVVWHPFASRATSDSGKYTNTYGTPVTIKCSFQSVSRQAANRMGLDLNKTYKKIYTNDPAMDVDRGRAGDRFVVDGRTYDAMGASDWFFQDKWKGVLVVDVGPEVVVP